MVLCPDILKQNEDADDWWEYITQFTNVSEGFPLLSAGTFLSFQWTGSEDNNIKFVAGFRKIISPEWGSSRWPPACNSGALLTELPLLVMLGSSSIQITLGWSRDIIHLQTHTMDAQTKLWLVTDQSHVVHQCRRVQKNHLMTGPEPATFSLQVRCSAN